MKARSAPYGITLRSHDMARCIERAPVCRVLSRRVSVPGEPGIVWRRASLMWCSCSGGMATVQNVRYQRRWKTTTLTLRCVYIYRYRRRTKRYFGSLDVFHSYQADRKVIFRPQLWLVRSRSRAKTVALICGAAQLVRGSGGRSPFTCSQTDNKRTEGHGRIKTSTPRSLQIMRQLSSYRARIRKLFQRHNPRRFQSSEESEGMFEAFGVLRTLSRSFDARNNDDGRPSESLQATQPRTPREGEENRTERSPAT